MGKRLLSFLRQKPESIFALVVAFLLASLLLVYLIDVINIFDLRNRLYRDSNIPFFWFHWFLTPVENPLQWLTLSGVMYLYFHNAKIAHNHGEKETFRFWGLMAIGSTLMLIEDSMDIRHGVRRFLQDATGGDPTGYGELATLFELGYFATIAMVITFALIWYRKVYWRQKKTKRYFVLGFIFYGIAVFSSWLGTAFQDRMQADGLYTVIGGKLASVVFSDQETLHLFGDNDFPVMPLEFYLMDRVYEESIELLGATALLVAGLSFYLEHQRQISETTSPEK